ncbi:hypothetical protein [Nocardiopsis alborubida]|uniref:Uncharacterized protein n=1 Tax=Nocardiopsis alborubida TaxID=146802 RepID=A0A7X6MF50_9ACTN|nr:hypothetical protein [Nocardiopsis alborubida]NKZ00093.1 hypothetical protein [Nocardiopsis alborubida]
MAHDDTTPAAGSVSIDGSLHGGAVSTGTGGSAEASAPAAAGPREETRRSGPVTPPRRTTRNRAPGSVTIGGDAREVAIATGDHGTARFEASSDAVLDERYRELLEQVLLLRQQLPLFAGAEGVAEVEAELVEAEEEITQTGTAAPGRLRRLWERLEQANTALGALSSATALAETVRQLTG